MILKDYKGRKTSDEDHVAPTVLVMAAVNIIHQVREIPPVYHLYTVHLDWPIKRQLYRHQFASVTRSLVDQAKDSARGHCRAVSLEEI